MKASVDKGICIGCGLCASTCPDVFSMDDDGKAIAIESDVPNNLEEDAIDARDGCPVSAIDVD